MPKSHWDQATLHSDNFHDQKFQPNHEPPHWHAPVTLTNKIWKKSRPGQYIFGSM